MADDSIKSAIEMYNYHGQLGLERTDVRHCSVVRDAANPDVWGSNKVFAITARSVSEIRELMQDVNEVFNGLPYLHFVVDPLTPESFQSYLALNEYSEYATILQMILKGPLKRQLPLPEADVQPVVSEEDWSVLRSLVLIDHEEGARTQSSLSEEVTNGIVSGYRSKSEGCQFFVAEVEGQRCAYGSGIAGNNGMGMIEDLFTLPEFRSRGLASTIIDHSVKFCREHGAEHLLIGSHASEPPKYLYNKLGFEPAFLTRDLIKQFKVENDELLKSLSTPPNV